MTDLTEQPEVPTEEESEQKPTTRRTRKKTGPRVVWVYGTHPAVISRTLLRLTNRYSEGYERLRIELGLALDQSVLTIGPDMRQRKELIQEVQGLQTKGLVVLVAGQDKDRQDPEIQELYGKAEVVFTHPAERQFLIDTGSGAAGSYKKAEEQKVGWLEYLATQFKASPVILR